MNMHLVRKIEKRLEEGFERGLFKASLRLLEDLDNPIRYNCFASALRELIRHFLSRLSPDESVKKCLWYKPDPNGKITRKQRMFYAIKGGLDDEFIKNELGLDFNQISRKLTKVIDELSKFAHIEQPVFNLPSHQVDQKVDEALIAMEEFFITIEDLKSYIISAYEERLQEVIDNAMIDDVIGDIDILATHYLVEESLIEKISVDYIDEYEVGLSIWGTVCVEHQFGSHGDYRRGDGLRFTSSYPFEVSTTIDVEEPLFVEISTDQIEVDTSDYYAE